MTVVAQSPIQEFAKTQPRFNHHWKLC